MIVMFDVFGLICSLGSYRSLGLLGCSVIQSPNGINREEAIERRALKFAQGFGECSDVSDSDMTREVSWVLD